MKRLIALLLLTMVLGFQANGEEYQWKAKWISKEQCSSETNTWMAFRKTVTIDKVPQSLVARIGADTKYWMWINGQMVVYEGGLKRGPSIGDGYYDKVEIAPYLHSGENMIAILVWYFGKSGFSHMSSGTVAMIFDARSPQVEILSDDTWEASVHNGYGTASCMEPNYRLPESNIRFEAGKFPEDWYKSEGGKSIGKALELGFAPGKAPLGALVERPIPMWKDYGLKEYVETRQSGDTLCCRLPYNCQFSPYIKMESAAGKVVEMKTDHDMVTAAKCISAEYVTRDGVQEYENLGFMTGEEMMYIIPAGVKVLEVKFRETGFDTEFAGSFECDDAFLNEYWKKAQRTLYICMRDTYYDCPDRERAQWWGDEVNELGEAFYAMDRNADKLARKGILELANWQKPDGVLYAPIPCSNYYKELPMQVLNSIGWYGFHDFYFYSGDSTFVAQVYGPMHKYIHEVWKLDKDRLPEYRTGAWDWPDAGAHQDGYAQLPLWYYLALKSELCFAKMLGKSADAAEDEALMAKIADSYNRIYWTGDKYMTPGHTDVPDDRVQALAVISGIASADKYPYIKKILSEEYHATTYMTPYVLEALYKMGEPQMAIDRMKRLYSTVMKDSCSTLYEHWNYEGSCNHAWSGGGIISMGRRMAGIEPTKPGFERFKVAPQMGNVNWIKEKVATNYGTIEVYLVRKGKRINATITVPEGTQCEVTLSNGKPAVLGPGIQTVKL